MVHLTLLLSEIIVLPCVVDILCSFLPDIRLSLCGIYLMPAFLLVSLPSCLQYSILIFLAVNRVLATVCDSIREVIKCSHSHSRLTGQEL